MMLCSDVMLSVVPPSGTSVRNLPVRDLLCRRPRWVVFTDKLERAKGKGFLGLVQAPLQSFFQKSSGCTTQPVSRWMQAGCFVSLARRLVISRKIVERHGGHGPKLHATFKSDMLRPTLKVKGSTWPIQVRPMLEQRRFDPYLKTCKDQPAKR